MEEDPSTHFLPEPLIVIISSPPPFLPVPGEPVVPWDRWQKSFQQYLEALSETSLADSSKCALLQHCLGREGRRVYETLIQDETSYAAAVSTLTIHFSSIHNPQMCRFRFKQRAQRPGESVDQFVSVLEELVKPCNYGDFEDEFILDQLIEKTSSIHLRERLLLEQNTLTLSRALIVGKQVEYTLGKPASPEEEVAARVDNEDRPVQRAVRGGRTRRVGRLRQEKPQGPETASNTRGHNKDNDDRSNNDKQYRVEDAGWIDDGNDNDGVDNDGVDDTEDEDFDYDDAKDKDYVVGDETDEDRDNNEANDEDDKVGGDEVNDEDRNGATDKDLEVDGDREVTGSKTKKKAYTCSICIDRSFRHASKLARHMRVHTKEKPFKCPACPMAFSQSYHMNSHLRNCHDDYNHAKDNEAGGDEADNVEVYDDTDDKGFPKTPKTEYSCSICTDKSFRHQSKLARHMKTHCKEKTFRCPVCDMTFTKSYHMTKHIKIKHRSGQYICPKCGKSLGSWAELKTHNSTHVRGTLEELACPVCNNKFRGKRALAGHIKTHSRARAETRRHTCTVCTKRFSSMYHLRRHMMTLHGVKPECHKCPHCQRSFPHAQALKSHQEVHSAESIGSREIEEKSYLCAVCGKKFHFQYALRNHERKHKEAPFYCSTCDKHFCDLPGYERHQRVHARREFKCPHCERVFLKNFKNHLRTHVKERPYQCSCCVESFTQQEDLERHCLKHKKFKKDKPYLCTRCGYAFPSMEELTAHMGLHKGEEPTTCPECGWTFLNKSKLEQHMSIHTGKGPHLCSYCGNVFSSSTTLKSHIRIHTGERPYKCPDCGKGFTSSSRLSVHSRQHMAVRPSFPCPDCGRTYGRMTELRMHQRYHTGDRPFLCNVCSKGFISKHKLSVHMRIHTGERPYSCTQCEQTFRQIGDRNRHMSKCH